MTAPDLAIVGRVRKAHGIRGELVVEPLTDAPDAVFAPGRRVFAGTVDGDPAADGRALIVRESRPFKGGGWIVAIDGITDRTEAERWRARYFLAPVSELAPPRDDEVYLHDLLGLTVVHAERNELLGHVADVYELPQGVMLDMQRADGGGRVLVPFRQEIVTAVDVAARRIAIDPPAGLIE